MLGAGDNWLPRNCGSRNRCDCIFTLDGASGELSGPNVFEPDVSVDGAEEWDAGANEHGHTRDDETIDQPRAKEGLNCESAVHVDVLEAPSFKQGEDFGGGSRLALDDRAAGSRTERSRAEDEDRFGAVRPGGEWQDYIVGISADDECVDRGEEVVIAIVPLAASARQEVERAVASGNEAVDARPDEDGCSHLRSPL